jgi:hypothetical protein
VTVVDDHGLVPTFDLGHEPVVLVEDPPACHDDSMARVGDDEVAIVVLLEYGGAEAPLQLANVVSDRGRREVQESGCAREPALLRYRDR